MLYTCGLPLTVVTTLMYTTFIFLLVCHWNTTLHRAVHDMCRPAQMLMSLVNPASGQQHCLWCFVRLRSVWSLALAADSWHLHHFPMLQTNRFCLVAIAKINMRLFSLMQNTSTHVIISESHIRTYSHSCMYFTLWQDTWSMKGSLHLPL